MFRFRSKFIGHMHSMRLYTLLAPARWLPCVVLLLAAGRASTDDPSQPSDVTYLMTQNFLTDLPERASGPFSQEVAEVVKTTRFTDYSNYNVQGCFDGHLMVTTDSNSPKYFDQRTVRVGRQSAVIGKPTSAAGSLGTLTLKTELYFTAAAHVRIWCHWWWPFPPFPVDSTLCESDINLNGLADTTVVVDVVQKAGTAGGYEFQEVPQVNFPSMQVNGCEGQGWFSKWLVGLITDRIADAIKARVSQYVAQQQQTLSVDQPVKITDAVTLVYHVNHLQMAANDSVAVHATVEVHALDPASGQTRVFSSHRASALPEQWPRYSLAPPNLHSIGPLALLSGMRFSPEVLTNIFRGLHASGSLQPVTHMTAYGAQLSGLVDMETPTVSMPASRRRANGRRAAAVAGRGGAVATVAATAAATTTTTTTTMTAPQGSNSSEAAGMMIRESQLIVAMSCKELGVPRNTSDYGADYCLLNATLANATETLLLALDNTKTGLTLQLHNMSLDQANVTAFASDSFFLGKSRLKALAKIMVEKALPQVNDQLAKNPLVFPPSLVPLVPNPELTSFPDTVDATTGKLIEEGYVQVKWQCDCTWTGAAVADAPPVGDDHPYDTCKNFRCPAINGSVNPPLPRRAQEEGGKRHSLPQTPTPAAGDVITAADAPPRPPPVASGVVVYVFDNTAKKGGAEDGAADEQGRCRLDRAGDRVTVLRLETSPNATDCFPEVAPSVAADVVGPAYSVWPIRDSATRPSDKGAGRGISPAAGAVRYGTTYGLHFSCPNSSSSGCAECAVQGPAGGVMVGEISREAASTWKPDPGSATNRSTTSNSSSSNNGTALPPLAGDRCVGGLAGHSGVSGAARCGGGSSRVSSDDVFLTLSSDANCSLAGGNLVHVNLGSRGECLPCAFAAATGATFYCSAKAMSSPFSVDLLRSSSASSSSSSSSATAAGYDIRMLCPSDSCDISSCLVNVTRLAESACTSGPPSGLAGGVVSLSLRRLAPVLNNLVCEAAPGAPLPLPAVIALAVAVPLIALGIAVVVGRRCRRTGRCARARKRISSCLVAYAGCLKKIGTAFGGAILAGGRFLRLLLMRGVRCPCEVRWLCRLEAQPWQRILAVALSSALLLASAVVWVTNNPLLRQLGHLERNVQFHDTLNTSSGGVVRSIEGAELLGVPLILVVLAVLVGVCLCGIARVVRRRELAAVDGEEAHPASGAGGCCGDCQWSFDWLVVVKGAPTIGVGGGGGSARRFPLDKDAAPSRRSTLALAALLFEAAGVAALLGFCLWRSFWGGVNLAPLLNNTNTTNGTDNGTSGGNATDADDASVFGFLGQGIDTVLIIQMVLAWMRPFFLASHVVPSVVVAVASIRMASWVSSQPDDDERLPPSAEVVRKVRGRLTLASGIIRPFVLIVLIVYIFLSEVASAILYRSGSVGVRLLWVALGSNALSVVTFLGCIAGGPCRHEPWFPGRSRCAKITFAAIATVAQAFAAGSLLWMLATGDGGVLDRKVDGSTVTESAAPSSSMWFATTVTVTAAALSAMSTSLFLGVVEASHWLRPAGSPALRPCFCCCFRRTGHFFEDPTSPRGAQRGDEPPESMPLATAADGGLTTPLLAGPSALTSCYAPDGDEEEGIKVADGDAPAPPPVGLYRQHAASGLAESHGASPLSGSDREAVRANDGHNNRDSGGGSGDPSRTADWLVGSSGVSCLMSLYRLLFEVKEAADRAAHGPRIKWRRICLLMGALLLWLGAYKDWVSVQGKDADTVAWNELNDNLRSLFGGDFTVQPSNSSVLAPLVKEYAMSLESRRLSGWVTAALFLIGSIVDLASSTPAALRASRYLGLAGALSAATSLFLGFTPDYVQHLNFTQTICRCGNEFCNVIGSTARAGFSAAMVFESGETFVPILVSMPWTLGRIAFFLDFEAVNRPLVRTLIWATVICTVRLTVLPVTAAYLYTPNAAITGWYGLFVALSTAVLLAIVNPEVVCCRGSLAGGGSEGEGGEGGGHRQRIKQCESFKDRLAQRSMIWYLIWGWCAFLLPMVALVGVATEMSFSQVISEVWQDVFSPEGWQNIFAEFALSDVVISDVFFMMLG